MGVRKLVKRIAKNGCLGIECKTDDCPFYGKDNRTCEAQQENGSGSDEVKAQAVQWLKDNPKKVKEKPDNGYCLHCDKKPQTEHKFNVGDRVVHEEYGIGTVVFTYLDGCGYAVHFDEKNDDLHGFETGDAPKCKNGHGWWCRENELTKASEKQPEWDGQFVPGRFYISDNGKIVCCTGHGETETSFAGVQVYGDTPIDGLFFDDCWLKGWFRPCEVEIKVKE